MRGISYDSAYVASFMKQIPGPVLAVGHSNGGAVISDAATALGNVVGLASGAQFRLLRQAPAQRLRAGLTPDTGT